MNPIFPTLPATLGVYTITRLLASHETTELYIAKQSHVDRSVVLEVMRPGMPQPVLDSFLRNARARVAQHVPHVSQVLESMSSKGTWYTTLECPDGTPLCRLKEQGKCLTTIQACAVIAQVADIYDYCARHDIAAGPVTADFIFIKSKTDEVTILSPVIAGKHMGNLLPAQQDSLAAALRAIRPVNMPGETRVNTLLDWLEQKTEDGQRLDWPTIASTARIVSDQVTPILRKQAIASSTPKSAATRSALRKQKSSVKTLLPWAAALLLTILISCLGFLIGPLMSGGQIPAQRDGYIFCATADGGMVVLPEKPVTIEVYNKFLQAYNEMTQAQRDAINLGIPPSELDHTPLDWDAQWDAVASGKKWHGKRLTLQSPVTGVSYWDAVACAHYLGGELPKCSVLRQARTGSGKAPCTEWTSSSRPADDIYGQARMLLPAGLADTPVLETDPATRREGRGFRLAYPRIPHQQP